MTEQKSQYPPTIDEIVPKKLSDIVDTEGANKYVIPSSLEEWEQLVQSDPNQEKRKASLAQLTASNPHTRGYKVGAPQAIELLIDPERNNIISDLLAYFVEAAIADARLLLDQLGKSKESVEFEEQQIPNDDFWLNEAQRRVRENQRLLNEAIALYSKYRWLYEHADDSHIQEEVGKAFRESKEMPRDFKK